MAEIPEFDKFRVIDLVTNTTYYSPRDSQHAVLIEVPSSELTKETLSLFSADKTTRITLLCYLRGWE